MTCELLLIVLLAFSGLVINGRFRLRPRPTLPAEEPAWPVAAVIVPVAGTSPAIKNALESILALDYPKYEAVFVTEGPSEPAAQVIARLMASGPHTPHIRHVVSCRTTGCSQKNWNMLAGVAATGPRAEIFAFADCTHLVPKTWLKSMVQPLIEENARVTTGYHRISPGRNLPSILGRSVTVLSLYLVQLVPGIAQIWGGNMAMSRNCFVSLGIEKLWAHTIADDIALTRALKKNRIKYSVIPAAETMTPLDAVSSKDWMAWTERQWLNLKFTMPVSWLVAGCACYIILFSIIFSLANCALAFGGAIEPGAALPHAFFIIAMAAVFSLTKSLHHGNCSHASWILAGCTTVAVACICHAKGFFSRQLHWANRSYLVGAGGRVISVTEHENG